MSIILRDYQDKLVADARAEVSAGQKSVIIQLPTGGGKTAVAATILKRATERGAHAQFWLHRREILKQSILEFDKVGISCGLVAAGFPANSKLPVQICSIQSLGRRVNTIARPDLIIVDEVHHCVSDSYSRLLAHYADAVVLGLTATPIRLDGAGLNKWFSSMVLGPSTGDLIAAGWLSPYRIFSPTRVDLSQVHTVAGDFNKKELDAAMKASAVAGDAVKHYQQHVMGKRALVFMWSIESSIAMAAKFNAVGVSAAHIDGTTPDQDRDRIIRDFSNGTIKVLTNVDIVAEGFNVPGIDALFLCRPTQSLGLFLQQIGRGLRPSDGKEYCVIFDHAGNTSRHGFPDDEREWSLDGKKKKKKSESDGPLCRTCPQCSETHPLHVRVCPCGYALVMEREVEVDEEAQLVEIDPVVARRQRVIEQANADSLEKLIAHGRSRGMRHPDLWAKHVFRAREEKKAAKERMRLESLTAGLPSLPEAPSAADPWAF